MAVVQEAAETAREETRIEAPTPFCRIKETAFSAEAAVELSERLAAAPPAARWAQLAALPAEELRPLAFQEVEARWHALELARENLRLQGLVAAQPSQASGRAREAALLRQLAGADRRSAEAAAREGALHAELAALREELADTKDASPAAPSSAPRAATVARSSRSDSAVVASLLAQSALRNFSGRSWSSLTTERAELSSSMEKFVQGSSSVEASVLELSTGSDAEAAFESDWQRAEIADTREELQAAATKAGEDSSPPLSAKRLLADTSWRRRPPGGEDHAQQLEVETQRRIRSERRLKSLTEAPDEGGSVASSVEAWEVSEQLSELSGMLDEVRAFRAELAAPTALRAEAAAAASPLDARRRVYGAVFAALVAGPEVEDCDVEEWLRPSLEAAAAAERAHGLRQEVAEVRELRAELRGAAPLTKKRASSWKTIFTEGDDETDPMMPRSSLCDGYDALSSIGIDSTAIEHRGSLATRDTFKSGD